MGQKPPQGIYPSIWEGAVTTSFKVAVYPRQLPSLTLQTFTDDVGGYMDMMKLTSQCIDNRVDYSIIYGQCRQLACELNCVGVITCTLPKSCILRRSET